MSARDDTHEQTWPGQPASLPPAVLPVGYLEHPPKHEVAHPPEIWRGFLPTRCIEQHGTRSVDLTGAVEIQLCTWLSGGSSHETLFQWTLDASDMPGLLLRRHGHDKLQLTAHDGHRQAYVWETIDSRRWHHVAARWRPGHLALYVDGELLCEHEVPIETLQENPRSGAFRLGSSVLSDHEHRDHLRGALCCPRIVYGAFDDERLREHARQILQHFADIETLVPQVPTDKGRVPTRALYAAADDVTVDFEANVRAAYETLLREGDVAVDVGAHSGKHTIPMARCVGPTGLVYAFEPLPDAFARLAAALRAENLAERVMAHNAAVADEARDDAPFFRVENRPGQSGLRQRERYRKPEWRPVPTTVRVLTLDDVIPLDRPVRFMKTDVEGAELEVLAGAERLIERHRPIVHFEHDAPAYEPFGTSPTDAYCFFANRDYILFDILGRRLRSLTDFVESCITAGVFDYIAVPREEPLVETLQYRLVTGWL